MIKETIDKVEKYKFLLTPDFSTYADMDLWRQLETVGKIANIKILEKADKSKSGSLPEEAHSSSAYIQLDKNGVFRRIRFYNENHLPVLELDYHAEKGLSKHGEPILHIHEYSKPGIDNRLPARAATLSEVKKYGIYLRGVFES